MNIIKKIMNIEFEKKCAFFMFFIGLIMMFLIPTWQIPDEYSHLVLIGEEIKNEEFAELFASNAVIPRGIIENQPDKAVDREDFIAGLTATPEYERSDLMIKGVRFSIIRHLPTIIGLELGVLLRLPIYWILQLGELFSLLFGITVCYFALKIMPIKKEMYAMAMLIPMTLQQIGGISYDAVLIPLCFLWIARLFYTKYKEEINLKDFLILFIVGVIITVIKLPYCFLAILIFILPLEKIHLRIGKYEIDKAWIKKYGVFIGVAGVIVGIAGIYCVRDNKWIQLLIGMAKEWRRTLYLLKETGVVWHEMLITSTVGNFGWLDTPISYGVAIFVIVTIFVASMIKDNNNVTITLRGRDRVVILGTVVIICVFTTLSMVNHTIMIILYGWEFMEKSYDIQTALYQIPYIGGVQGRYYLPFVSLFCLPLPQFIKIDNKIVRVLISIFEVTLYGYVIFILLNRYWL